MSDLLARLQHARDELAALKAYGNDGDARGNQARERLAAAVAEVPDEISRLFAMDKLDEDLLAQLQDFIPPEQWPQGKEPAHAAARRTRRSG